MAEQTLGPSGGIAGSVFLANFPVWHLGRASSFAKAMEDRDTRPSSLSHITTNHFFNIHVQEHAKE
jgi:hypothetical protein